MLQLLHITIGLTATFQTSVAGLQHCNRCITANFYYIRTNPYTTGLFGSTQDCHSTPGLLRGNEPGNEARIDSLCETLTGKITLHFRSCVKFMSSTYRQLEYAPQFV